MKKTDHAYPADSYQGQRGMTLRDYFAGQVISSLSDDYLPREAARRAYEIADAMMEVRNVP